jgi:hypothetical protein
MPGVSAPFEYGLQQSSAKLSKSCPLAEQSEQRHACQAEAETHQAWQRPGLLCDCAARRPDRLGRLVDVLRSRHAHAFAPVCRS